MKLLSWNVNGLRAIYKKGAFDAVYEVDPDIICLQETKAHPEQLRRKFALLPDILRILTIQN